MNDVNSIVIVGRLVRDAELKTTKTGVVVLKFSVAVNSSKKDGDKWVDIPSFFDVQFWGKSAAAISSYLTKGKQIAIAGELRQERWTDTEGKSCSKIIINATHIQLLGSKTTSQQEPTFTPGEGGIPF